MMSNSGAPGWAGSAVEGGQSRAPVRAWAFLGILLGFLAAADLPAQVTDLTGRVLDEATGEPVAGAVISLVGLDRSALSDAHGIFHLGAVAPGSYTLRVVHLAYGEHEDPLRVAGSRRVALRIALSPTALVLEPVVVEARSAESRDARGRGTRRNVVTRAEIESSLGTARHLGQVLRQHVSGVRIKQDQNRPGTAICVEFRIPRSIQDPFSCKSPTVFVDGARVADPQVLWTTMPVENVESMELLPGAEAGVLYGTDSNYGVLLIETRSGLRPDAGPRRSATYDWALEREPYPWLKVFASAFLGNAVGVGLGVLAGSQCLDTRGLTDVFTETRCGGLANLGATVAMVGLPLTGATLGARWSGGTDLSQGRWLPSVVAGALMLVPGYFLAAADDDESFPGSRVVGGVMVLVGVPLTTTLADRLFRSIRGVPDEAF